MTLVLDASVALKWYVPEEHADVAQSILRCGEQVIAPRLVVAAVANAKLRTSPFQVQVLQSWRPN